MMLLQDINRMKNLKFKKSKRERLNSAIFPKNVKETLKLIDNHSYIFSHHYNHINNLLEETKSISTSNYNSSLFISENLKNNLKKNLKIPIKINNLNEKVKTEKVTIYNQFDDKNKRKKKCVFLTYKDNYNNNRKKYNYNQININKFIYRINSFLLPNDQTFENLKKLINYRITNKEPSKNSDLYKLLKRDDNSNRLITYELFYKYIIKRTFKEGLKKGYSKNSLIDKTDIKDEYQRQLNEIRQYLKLYNKELKDLFYNNYLESFDKNRYIPSSNNLYENKISPNKIYQMVNIRKFRKINQNNSVDNIYFHFFNFDQASIELNNHYLNKNQEITKRKFRILLSLSDNNKSAEKNRIRDSYIKMVQNTEEFQNITGINTDKNKNNAVNKRENDNIANNNITEHFKTNFAYPKEKKIKETIIKNNKKIIINNNEKLKLNKNKRDNQFNTEISNNEKIKKFNFFLDRHNKISNKNEDIINFLNNKEKKNKFSNLLINDNINQYLFNQKKYKSEINQDKEDVNQKKDTYINLTSENSNINSEAFNNSLNLENDFNGKDLSLQAQPKYDSALKKNTNPQKSLFEGKFVIDKSLFTFNKDIQQKKKSMNQNYSELFQKPIKEDSNNENERNIKILFNKKLFLKKKKAIKERSFKDFIQDEKIEEKSKTKNNQTEEIKIVEYKEKKDDIKQKKSKEKEEEKLMEEDWEFRFNNFKNYIQKLKNMSKDEFVNDTLKFIKYYK